MSLIIWTKLNNFILDIRIWQAIKRKRWNETKRNRTKWNRNETKAQSDIGTCTCRSSCPRLSECEHVSVKNCSSTNKLRWKVDQFDDPCGVEKCHPTSAVHIICIYYFTRSVLFNWQSSHSESWTTSADDVANSTHSPECVQAAEVAIIEMWAHLFMSFLFTRSCICTIMLWQQDSSHLAWWMFTTTPIFDAPVSDVAPLTLLRVKFQKKFGLNYRLNNGYFLSGRLGLTNICFYFCCCKSFHPWFCTLIAFSVTGLVHVIVVCLITTQNTSQWSIAPKLERAALKRWVPVSAWGRDFQFRFVVSFRFVSPFPFRVL